MAEKEEQSSKAAEFAAGAQTKSVGIVSELFEFLRVNKKWWLLPIVFVLLLLALLIVLGGTALAPFIYTVF